MFQRKFDIKLIVMENLEQREIGRSGVYPHRYLHKLNCTLSDSQQRAMFRLTGQYSDARATEILLAKRANTGSRRADLRTADLLQLRVITQVLRGCAGGCKCPISRPVSLLCLAVRCTVLRSRWYQSGIKPPLSEFVFSNLGLCVPCRADFGQMVT